MIEIPFFLKSLLLLMTICIFLLGSDSGNDLFF